MAKEKTLTLCNKIIEICLYIVIYTIPFSRALLESAAITAIVVWCFKKIFIQRNGVCMPSNFSYPIFLYIAICIISCMFSTNIPLSLRIFFRKTLEYLLLFFVVIDITSDKRIMKRICYVFIAIIGLVGIDGIFQYFIGWDFFRCRTMVIKGRISGPFIYPGDLGAYLVTVVPLVLSTLFIKFKRYYLKMILGIILMFSTVSLVLTISKSAWLAFVASIFMGAVIVRKRGYIILIPALLLIVIFLFADSDSLLKSRLKDFFVSSEGGGRDRKMLWQGGWDMFMEKPFFGQGLGTYMYNFQRFRPKGYPDAWGISYPHNCFLQMLAEIGIFGMLAFIWMIAVILLYVAKLLLRNKEEISMHTILWGLSVGLIAYLIQSSFDTSLYSLPLAILFWLILGLVISTIKIIQQENIL